jgi:hypothetical protein
VRPIQHVEWVLAVILDQAVTTKRVYGNSGSLGAHDRDVLLARWVPKKGLPNNSGKREAWMRIMYMFW